MGPHARAAERCLRRMSVAVKTFAMYPSTHPMCTQVADGLLADLCQYMDLHGPFAARVTKYAMSLDSETFEGGGHSTLAYYLFIRKLAGFTVKPGVTLQELTALLSIVSKDRLSLEGSAGVAYLLWQADVKHVEVAELTLDKAPEQEILGLSAFYALIGRGRLAPAERERIVEIVRSGADQVARLLDNLYEATVEVFKDIAEADRVQHVYQAIRALDRVILDEPLEDQPALLANLAAGQLHVSESLRRSLQQALLSRAEDDPAMKVLMDELSPEQLAQVIFGALSSGNVAEQVADYQRKLGADREKMRAVIVSLESRLEAQGAAPGWLSDAVLPRIQTPLPAQEPEFPAVDLGHDEIAISDRDYQHRLDEARAIDEAAAIREVIRALVEVLRYEEDMDNLTAIVESLAGHLPWILEQREFGFLAEVLDGVKAITRSSTGRRAELAAGLLKKVADAPMHDALLGALWDARGTPDERELQVCFQMVADHMITTVVRHLREEPRAAMRAVLCDLLVAMGPEHILELGAFVSDSRWYLVRNIASILGRLRHPQSLPYLKRLAHHEEWRVRRETVDALAAIGTEEAMAILIEFLADRDQRIRLRGLRGLDARGARQALPWLASLLDTSDFFNRQFELKQEAIETLGRIGGEEALAVLRRLARRHLVFSGRGRELRRLARVTVGIIEMQEPPQQRSLITASRS